MDQTEIDDLASLVYPMLTKVAATRRGTIAYSQVCERLTGRWSGLEPRSALLASALGTIVGACRDADLPALSALVVHAGSDKRPGDGYYDAAHPGLSDRMQQEVAWAREVEATRSAVYPPTLNELWERR